MLRRLRNHNVQDRRLWCARRAAHQLDGIRQHLIGSWDVSWGLITDSLLEKRQGSSRIAGYSPATRSAAVVQTRGGHPLQQEDHHTAQEQRGSTQQAELYGGGRREILPSIDQIHVGFVAVLIVVFVQAIDEEAVLGFCLFVPKGSVHRHRLLRGPVAVERSRRLAAQCVSSGHGPPSRREILVHREIELRAWHKMSTRKGFSSSLSWLSGLVQNLVLIVL